MKRSLFVLLGCVLLAGCSEQTHKFRLLEPPLPFDHDVAEELVEVFEESSDHSIELVPIPEGFDSPLAALESGYADLAFASNVQPFREDVTTVMPLYPTVLHIFYRQGRDTSDLETLFEDASIFAGNPGSASHQLMTSILEDMHVEVEEVEFSDETDVLPDVILIYMPISPQRLITRIREINADGMYEMLSFGSPYDIGTGSLVDRAVLLDPRLEPFVIPFGTYDDLTPSPIVTLAVDKLLVANAELPEAEVYDLINEIRRLQPGLAATDPPLFEGLSDEFDSSDSTFVLHPGAQAFTQRDAPDIYERYSGVAEVLVTLVIGLISGIYAVLQIYHRRQKNRIDAFYTDVMALRDSITKDSTRADRESAIHQVKELQNRAFEMLVSEKVAADESFRIFVTLSNDIIADLRNPVA